MCGIIGLYCKTGKKNPNENFVHQALFAGQLRGEHGTGLAVVPERDKEPDVYKRALPAYDFLSLKETDTLLSRVAWARCVIGHNRMKTHGRQINAHTHPFEHNHITLVHNGVVSTYKLPGKQDVDSEQIAHALSLLTVQEVIPKLEGSFALVWWDSSEEAMYAIRNSERPLWFGKNKAEDTVFFASELGMLRWVCSRNGVELTEVYQPEPGQLLKFSGGNITPEKSQIELYKPVQNHNHGNKWIDHKVLKDNGLHIGSEVEVHPIYWTPHSINRDVDENSYGELVCMSVDHACFFKNTSTKYKEYDASKSYKVNVCGSSYSATAGDMALINQLKASGDNAFGLENDDVYMANHANTAALIKDRVQEVGQALIDLKTAEEAVQEMLPGPNNQLIKLEEYKRLIRHGCSMCGDPLNVSEAPHIFDRYHNVYCATCGNDEALMDGVTKGAIAVRNH